MKLKRRSDGNNGFTIIEVMIVLAVTSLMFLSIVILVNGKQQTAQFHTAINNVQSQIEQVINETANGYYPTANFDCSSGGGSGPLSITSNMSPNQQGAHNGCVFLGKAIHFNNGSNNFAIYPFAGLQSATIAATPGQLYTARPTVITQSIATMPLEAGLSVKYMKYVDATTHTSTTAGSMAFMQSFGGAAAATTSGSSGSQNLDLVMPTGSAGSSITNTNEVTTLNNAFEAVQSAFNTTYASSALAPATSAQICFNSGTTQQSGLITVGDSLNGLAVTLKIFSAMDCGS